MIHSQKVNEQGIVGKLFFPEVATSRPAVVVLSGSEGGIYSSKAKLFAQEGYISFALGYCNAPGLPDHLENIPLEYFLKSFQWLRSQPLVKNRRMHLIAPSRGGELVLLLATLFPDDIASVVAIVPSCVTNSGIPNVKMAAWTFQGKPLPVASPPTEEDVHRQLKTQKTIHLCDLFLEKMKDTKSFEAAAIKVENIQCPLLLISGKEDKMWPSSTYCELILERLKACKSSIPREHLCYEQAGHIFTSPYASPITGSIKHPITKLRYEVGGTPEVQAAASKDSWEKILQFFAQHSKE